MSPFALFTDALLAYCVHEHQLGHVKRIDAWVQPRSFTVQDDGRAIIAAATPRFTVESRRGDNLWTQRFAWGVAEAPATSAPTTSSARGTRVTIDLAPGAPAFDAATVQVQAARWRQSNPDLTLEVH